MNRNQTLSLTAVIALALGTFIHNTSAKQLGADDFQISAPSGGTRHHSHTDTAYNSIRDEYFVVWESRTSEGGGGQIVGQRLDASNGTPVGPQLIIAEGFQRSGLGAPSHPTAAFNPRTNSYGVFWEQELVDPLNGNHTGTAIAARRIIGTGPTMSLMEVFSDGALVNLEVASPDAVVSLDSDSFHVAFSSKTFGSSAAPEIWLLSIDDIFAGSPQASRMSDMGGSASDGFGAYNPAVAIDFRNDKLCIVWEGETGVGSKTEIYYEFFDVASLSQIGFNDQRISSTGDANVSTARARKPHVVVNNSTDDFVIVWEASVAEAEDIMALRLGSNGLVSVPAKKINNPDPGNPQARRAADPSVVFAPERNQYVVTWAADSGLFGHADDEWEIFARRLDKDLVTLDTKDYPLSRFGPTGNARYGCFAPSVSYWRGTDDFFAVWQATVRGNGDADLTSEIHGQRFDWSAPEPRIVEVVIDGEDGIIVSEIPELPGERFYTIETGTALRNGAWSTLAGIGSGAAEGSGGFSAFRHVGGASGEARFWRLSENEGPR